MINEDLDLPASVQATPNKGGKPETVANPAIPAQWFKADIRLGSLTLHLDEDSWSKATMSASDYNRIKATFSAHGDNDKYQKTEGPVNLGERLVA